MAFKRPIRYYFGFAKAKVTDEEVQQLRSIAANNLVASAFSDSNVEKTIFNENVLTPEVASANPSSVLITKESLKAKLGALKDKLKPEDTVIIYSHTHGFDHRLDGGKLIEGGLLILQEKLTWTEYAELISNLPARNVLVFTMACYSGNLIDRLTSQKLRPFWENRVIEGRSFLVMSAQNSDRLSGPANINGELINALPYAAHQTFTGLADGYVDGRIDGKLDLDEIAQHTLYLSRTVGVNNTNDSQMIGSYPPRQVLWEK